MEKAIFNNVGISQFFVYFVVLGPILAHGPNTANYYLHDSAGNGLPSISYFAFNNVSVILNWITPYVLVSTVHWKDEIAYWNSSAFGGVETVLIPSSMLWRPDIIVTTSLTADDMTPEDQRLLRVRSDGTVLSDSLLIITNTCALNISAFPFDEQTCAIMMSSWMHSAAEIDLIVTHTEQYGIKNNFMDFSFRGNGEWKLVSIKANISRLTWNELGISKEFVYVIYTIQLKRQPVYYICVILIPTILTATICLFGLFAPATNTGERIEKVNMGLATMLSMAVILGIVAGEMPKSSTLPLLGYYVLAELLLCSMGVGISMIIMLAHQRVETRLILPPNWLAMILCFNRKIFLKPEKMSEKKFTENSLKTVNNHPSNEIESVRNSFLANQLRIILDKVGKYIDGKKHDEEIGLQWTMIFDRIDIFFLVLFNFVNLVMSSWLLLW